MTQTLDDSAALLQLLSAPGAAVFLDFDGTLVDLAPTPDGVRLEPGVVEALGDALPARLAVNRQLQQEFGQFER